MKNALISLFLFLFFPVLKLNAQWVSSNTGLYGGPINDLIVKGSDFFAATPGGVYLSSNNGISWAPVNSGLSSTYVNCLTQNDGIIYAGTNGGVFISTNNGTSWTNSSSTLPYVVLAITVANGSAFAGTQQGIYRSIDNGINWEEINTGLTNTSINSLTISGNKIFAGTSSGLFVSSDNGNNWSLTSQTNIIISSASNSANIFAGTLNGLYLSTDEGINWTAINSGLPPGFLVLSFAFDNGKVYAGTGSGVYVSSDNGTNWASTASFTSTNVESLAVGNGNILAGTASDIFRSTDNGASWAASNTGLTNTDVRAFAVNGSSTFVGTFGNGAFISNNSGLSWIEKSTNLTDKYIRALAYSGGFLFVGTTNGRLFTSSNNGNTWIPTGLNQSVNAIAINGSDIFTGTFGGGVYVSSNNGANWTSVNNGLTNTFVYSININAGGIFVGTGNGVFLSVNNGASWVSVSTGLPLNSRINSLAISNGKLFAATDGGLFISSDNGTNWMTASIPDYYMNVVMVFNNNIFAASAYGNLYVSKNNGVNWTNIGSPSTGWGNDVSIGSVIVSDTNLLVGTNKGVWSRSLTDALKEPQTISFNPLPSKTIGDAPFILSATSSSGLTVVYISSDPTVASISTNIVTILKAGTTTIKASQAGDNIYKEASDVDQTLIVNKASQTITFGTLTSKTFGDANFNLSASSSSGLTVNFSSSNTSVATVNGNVVTIVGGGSIDIIASQAGNGNYNSATNVTRILQVNKANQSITFSTLSAKTIGDASFALSATSSSALPVSFRTTTPTKISISGNQVSISSAGQATIIASQSGSASFNAAAEVSQSFCINPAKPTITVTNPNTDSPTLTSSATSGNQWFKDGVALSGATNATLTVNSSGVYSVESIVETCKGARSNDLPLIVTGDISTQANELLEISPNPTKDVVIFKLPGVERKYISIFDVNGRSMEFASTEKSEIEIDVRSYSFGYYLVKVKTSKGLYYGKFVKN
jgi:ligand-binding sensor domain-containing protein